MSITNRINNLQDFFTEKRLLYIVLGLVAIIFIGILILSEGYSGGADSISHYQLSRYAFRFPELFLDHWGKPVFTLLSSPFSQLGFKGIQLFNIIAGLATAYVTYLVTKELNIKRPVLAIVICCFAPVYMLNVFSGLTEYLFAFVAILTSYLMLRKKYLAAAIVVSFLPLVRTEGIILLPIYAMYLIRRRHYREILFMLTGFVVYSIIGFLAGKSILWLITEVPYRGAVEIYGRGPLFSFVKRSPGYFGIPNEIFFVTGLVAGLTLYIRDKKEYSQEFLLVVLPFLTYFIGHSLSWWSGIGGSMGLKRYMAAIVPFMAVMATRGLTLFALMFQILFKREWIRVAALIVGVISVVHIPFVVQNYPIRPEPAEVQVKKASEWIKSEGYTGKIFYFDPAFGYFHALDPFDSKKCQKSIQDPLSPHESMSNGDLLVYDEHFGHIANVRYGSLLSNINLELLRVFKPDVPFKVFDTEYKIAIFKRVEPDSTVVERNFARNRENE